MIVVGFSYLYFVYQIVPSLEAFFYGINPVVIGLIVGASYSMYQSALAGADDDLSISVGSDEWTVDYKLTALLVRALLATVVFNPNPVIEFVVTGLLAIGIYRTDWVRANVRTVSLTAVIGIVLGLFYVSWDQFTGVIGSRIEGLVRGTSIATAALALWSNVWIKLFLFLVYTGSFIYGGAWC